MTPEGEHTLRLVRNEKMHRHKRAATYVNDMKTEVRKRVSMANFFSELFLMLCDGDLANFLQPITVEMAFLIDFFGENFAVQIFLKLMVRTSLKIHVHTTSGCELLSRYRRGIRLCRIRKKRR